MRSPALQAAPSARKQIGASLGAYGLTSRDGGRAYWVNLRENSQAEQPVLAASRKLAATSGLLRARHRRDIIRSHHRFSCRGRVREGSPRQVASKCSKPFSLAKATPPSRTCPCALTAQHDGCRPQRPSVCGRNLPATCAPAVLPALAT